MNPQTPPTVPEVAPCVITAARLRAVIPGFDPIDAERHAAALEAVRADADLTTTRRVRHFLAQVAHETQGFRRLTENMMYRNAARLDGLFSAVRDIAHARALVAAGPQAIANCVYAKRGGNGDARSFDGWNFRGRGYLHHTFRDGYAELQRETGLPLLKSPELLENPVEAARAAAAWWRLRGMNARADTDDVRAVTRVINPALAGIDDRIAWSGRFRPIYP